jgi:hypothetical protein
MRVPSSILVAVHVARPMSRANVESDSFHFKSVFHKTFQNRDIFIFFDRSAFCAYKFRVYPFSLADRFKKKDSKDLSFNHSMFWRLLIHA